jgi:hypothetical protein
MKTKTIFNLSLALCLCFVSTVLLAQGPDDGGPTPVPVDGGIATLVAGGAAIGYRYFRKGK